MDKALLGFAWRTHWPVLKATLKVADTFSCVKCTDKVQN
jgi:hypothetical protein